MHINRQIFKLHSILKYLFFGILSGIFFTHILLQIVSLILIGILFVYLWKHPQCSIEPFHYLIIGYLLTGLLGLFFPRHHLHDLPSIMPFLILIGILPLSFWLREETSFTSNRWLIVVSFFATLTAMVGIFNHFQGIERTRGFFGGYFTLAGLMAFSLPITCGLFFNSRLKYKIVLGASAYIQLLALWWTYTRSGFLAVIVGIGLWVLHLLFGELRSVRKLSCNFWQKAIFLISIPIFLGTLILFSENSRINPFLSTPATTIASEKDYSSGRISIWEDARRIIRKDVGNQNYPRILLGHGLRSRSYLVESTFTSWESDYLQVLMNHGILGLIIILLIYANFLKLVWQGLCSANILPNSTAISGISYWIMSFLTLQICSFTGAGIFVVIYIILSKHKRDGQ